MTGTLHTIGFIKKSAAEFFKALELAEVGTVVDVRINNTSQLAGFTKKDDLAFFLREVSGVHYIHEVNLAPTQELMKSYRGKQIGGDELSAHTWSCCDQEESVIGSMNSTIGPIRYFCAQSRMQRTVTAGSRLGICNCPRVISRLFIFSPSRDC